MSATVLDRLRPRRATLKLLAFLVAAELLVLAAYFDRMGFVPSRVGVYLYPFVWINVAVWGVRRARTRSTTPGRAALAALVALGYFIVLGYVGGLFAVGPTEFAAGVDVRYWSLPPGWSPAVLYTGPSLTLALVPYRVIGNAALAYLVYGVVVDASGGRGGAAAGLLGLFSCVSCTLPVVAGVLGGVVGGSSALVSAAYGQSYGLSTVVFVLTVALLVWRPTAADVSRVRSWLGR